MDRIKSTEEFITLTHRDNEKIIFFSNVYLIGNKAEDYILKQRLYFEKGEGWISFYLDNFSHYTLFVIVYENSVLNLERLSKPIFFYFLRKGNHRREELIDTILEKSGFEHTGKLIGYEYDPKDVLAATDRYEKHIKNLISLSGLRIIYPEYDMYDRINRFMLDIDEIPVYQIENRSFDEFRADVDNRMVRCVVDKDNDICGLYYSYEKNKYEYGIIAIKKEYRVGVLSVALMRDKMLHMIQRGKKGRGWIDEKNKESISFHKRWGYRENNRIREEYVLEN